MKVSKKAIKKWTAALRSNKYQQTINHLQDADGYCCLGVACELFIKPELVQPKGDGYIYGGMPDDQENAPKWLKAIADDFNNKTYAELQALNDKGLIDNHTRLEPFTFEEIADLLEAVYIHEVL